MAAPTKEYSPSWLAGLFHSFPHLDLYMRKVDSDFNPENPQYGESLVFWGAVPILWLVLTLLLFLVYFCYRCCQRDVEKQRPVPCLRWSMAVLAIFTVGAAGVAFYGNEQANTGVSGFKTAMSDCDATVASIEREVSQVNQTINSVIIVELKQLQQVVSDPRSGLRKDQQEEINGGLRKSINKAQNLLGQVSVINEEAAKVNMTDVAEKIHSYNFYRWVATLAVLCWKVLLCLVLLVGVARTSKYTLLFFSACGIFTLVLCWALAGLHLSACVGLGDYCVDPKTFVQTVGSKYLKKETVAYYLSCNKDAKDPFKKELNRAVRNMLNINSSVDTAVKKAQEKHVPVNKLEPHVDSLVPAMNKISDHVKTLTALVDCKMINEDYRESSDKLCHQALPGVTFVFLGAAVAGILLSILVLLASKAWRHFGTSNQPAQKDDLWQKGYYEVDQDDPFVPRGDNASPSYYRYGSLPSVRPNSYHEENSRGHHTFPREHMAMERRGTPPPAYNGFEPYSSNTLPLSHSTEDHRIDRPMDRPSATSRQTFSRESQA